MEDKQLYIMLRSLFQHTQSMRKCQRDVEIIGTKYDKKKAKMYEQQVDMDIRNINSYIREFMSPPSTPTT